MKETELWELLVSLSGNEISLSEAHDQILCLFSVVGQSEQLVCDECNFVELQGDIYQCTKCFKVEDRLAN